MIDIMAGLFIEGNICLDDIPAEKIYTAKNGKRYVRFTISERRSIGDYGETHSLYVSRQKPHTGGSKFEFEKIYIGSAKPFDTK